TPTTSSRMYWRRSRLCERSLSRKLRSHRRCGRTNRCATSNCGRTQGGCGNRNAERLAQTGVAPIVHVQAVSRHECFECQVTCRIPASHQLKTVKYIYVLRLRTGGNKLD